MMTVIQCKNKKISQNKDGVCVVLVTSAGVMTYCSPQVFTAEITALPTRKQPSADVLAVVVLLG